ncbi:MAG TPA: hypothetical protein VJS64_20145 [Pyrinomonadaceae bacterium]|nr:hypothetical protein [Pyrinomonadaceae bacterium]
MSLRIVKELVLSDGVALTQSEGGVTGIRRWQCQKGMRLGAKLVFCGLVCAPPAIVFSLITDTPPYFLYLSFMIVLAGICRMLYARLFEGADSPFPGPQIAVRQNPSPPPASFEARPTAQSLSQSPMSAAPQSVTEHTTKLLDV